MNFNCLFRFYSIRFNSEVYCLHLSYDSKSTNHYHFFMFSYLFVLLFLLFSLVFILIIAFRRVWVCFDYFCMERLWFWQHSTHTDLGVKFNYQQYLHTRTRTHRHTNLCYTHMLITDSALSPAAYIYKENEHSLLFWREKNNELSSIRYKHCCNPLNRDDAMWMLSRI